MNRREDQDTKRRLWSAVARRFADEAQARLDPPTVDELLAYATGMLKPADEDHVREQLVAYQEIARLYTSIMLAAQGQAHPATSGRTPPLTIWISQAIAIAALSFTALTLLARKRSAR